MTDPTPESRLLIPEEYTRAIHAAFWAPSPLEALIPDLDLTGSDGETPRDPRYLLCETVAQLDALPVGAILRGKDGGVWEVDDPETDGTEIRYKGAGVRDYHTGRILLDLYGPMTCVWSPR